MTRENRSHVLLLFFALISAVGNLLLTVSPTLANKAYESHVKMLKSTRRKINKKSTFLSGKLLNVTEITESFIAVQ